MHPDGVVEAIFEAGRRAPSVVQQTQLVILFSSTYRMVDH
jgi:hypothetical protein